VTARLLSTFSDLEASSSKPAAQPLDPLTEREEEVLVTVARGRTNAEIADRLTVAPCTVRKHLEKTQKFSIASIFLDDYS
jgi:DNA-binding NarL/FixJ family response regulator